MLQPRFLKKLDTTVGPHLVRLCSLLSPARRGEAAVPGSLLVLRPGGIGDAILLIPALQAVRERFPRVRLTVLAEKRNAAAFSLCREVDHVLRYDRPYELAQAVSARYDAVVDTEQWHRLSAVVARLCRAPVAVGFATNERGSLFSHPVPYSHDEYEVESFFNLVASLGVIPPLAAHVPFLHLSAEAVRRADELLEGVSGGRLIAFFPGASIPERRWGGERFRRVAQSLEKKGYTVIVVGGREDAAEGGAIVAGTAGLNLAGRTSLAETAAVLARCALLVSGDSGVLHIAVGLGIPTVSLFGPGIERKWGPKGEGHVVLNRRLSCSPCTRFGTTPPCPSAARCMREITVPEVVAAAEALLSRGRKRERG